MKTSEMYRQLQTSEQRFRAMSALINATSPEKKMDRNKKLRALLEKSHPKGNSFRAQIKIVS